MAGINSATSQNLTTFREEGLVHLSGVIDPGEIAALKRHFWHEVEERFAIGEEDVQTWFANPHNPAGDSRARRLSGMNPVMSNLRSADRLHTAQTTIQGAFDTLFGADRWEPLETWYSLLSFPGDQSEWSIPENSWHNDEPIVVGHHEPWSIFAFVFLDHVALETGPTLAVTGSHRRGELIAAAKGVRNEREVRAFENVNSGLVPNPGEVELLAVGELLPELITTDEWFADLVGKGTNDGRTHRLMQAGVSHLGIQSRVVDIAGEPGDVVLFDPRCLHTASANVSERPRQILRLDFRKTIPSEA